MAKKLDWEQSDKEKLVAVRGGERTQVTRFRSVAPSDKEVDRLAAIGYSGKRPATQGEVKRLLREWAPQWSRITPAEMRKLRSSRSDARKAEAGRLLDKLAVALANELSRQEANVGMKPGGRLKVRHRLRHEQEHFAAELTRLAGK